MALSNWDTLALTAEGPCNGAFTSPLGVTVEIYKNWLYVRDPEAWREGRYTEPVIMEIQHGEVNYRDVCILAQRGPQNGVYVMVWSGYEWNPGADMMVGCGVYGFSERQSDEVEVKPEDYQWLGVTDESLAFLRQMVVERLDQDWHEPHAILADSVWEGAVRFNQGDAFFMGADEAATAVGDGEAPLIMQMLGDQDGDG
jgi:hypothetical protein